MEKQYIIDDMTLRDSWRLFHIMAEFVEGFEKLSEVKPAITVFGSARTKEGDDLYTKAYDLAMTLGKYKFNLITGGGPGVMEAVNKGAAAAGVKSVGINIELPFEQKPNTYINLPLTLDELFEAITLIQTKKIRPFPVILMGKDYWGEMITFMQEHMLKRNMISKEDLNIFVIMDDPEEIAEYIKKFVIL